MARNGFPIPNAAVAILAVLLCTILGRGCCADSASPDYSVVYGYDYDYGTYEAGVVQDCTVDKAGKVHFADGAVCDIRVEGVDKQADLLSGGIDGVYKPFSCQDGKPAFLRHNSPKGEERVLWWSRAFGDWDISRGSSPNEVDVLMFGGALRNGSWVDSLPLSVKDWHLGGNLTSGTNKADQANTGVYVPITATISCTFDEVHEVPEVQKLVQGPTTEQQATA